jgi:uncharacterized protein YaaN involved in tellurite resistance
MSNQQPVALDQAVRLPMEVPPMAGEIVPGITAQPVPYEEVDEQRKVVIDELIKEIDVADSRSIMFFGSKAQQQLTSVSESMLEGVKNKDVGAAGGALNEMVSTLRGFNVDEFDPNRRPGFFERVFSKAKPIAKFLQQYETVRRQIDTITDELERHKTKLLTDITSLDRLYDANLDYFRTLELYIAAGQEKLRELDQEILPAKASMVETTEEVIAAQELRDLRAARDDLERRVHDLVLTRQVTLQSLPSIRLVQENDKGLVNKIASTLVNTIPLWRQQLATAVTIFRSGEAAKTVKAATDLTNDLLAANAENLKMATSEARRQIERGVFDVEVVKKANQTLIATIQESLQIADEGKRRRVDAMNQLELCETELRKTLAAASARSDA